MESRISAGFSVKRVLNDSGVT